MHRLAAAVAAALALLALVPAAPAAAQATAPPGTIVFIQDGDVVAATPDGSRRHVVAEGEDWETPAIADDGTVVATRPGVGGSEIVRMTQSGQVLSAFVPTPQFAGGIYDLEVSEDGQFVAYATIMLCNRPDGSFDSCRSTDIVHADGRSPDSLGGVVQALGLTFVPPSLGVTQPTVVTRGFDWFTVGDEQERDWFDEGVVDTADIDISRDGSLLAVAGCDYDLTDDFLGCVPSVTFRPLTADFPAPAGPKHDCVLSNGEQAVSYDDISISPDSTGLVFTERPQDAETDVPGDVKVITGFAADPCGAGPEYVLAAGATDPFWGAADYDPTGSGGPGGPGDPGQPGDPGDPAGAFRVDGGGAADPIGQAVATSRSLFEDGQATRVVLATADRFPDALAGAALAGTRGPILLTPSTGPLDPRVADEIARVTGGDGVVLTLGGEVAVSEAAAQEARAAAGSRPCSAPMPTSCRYAGSGREVTAALIAETVLAETPGDRVLIARGDAFADAITGGAYAARAGVPILLTPSSQLADATRAFLQAHPQVTEAVVLGGEAAVAQPVADSLPVASVRRVSGADRTATSAAIATQLWQAEGLAGGGVVVVNVRHDQGWQTALAAAVVSAAVGAPQLGVENPPAAPSQAVLDAARAVGTSQVITFGGADLVSGAQLTAIAAAG